MDLRIVELCTNVLPCPPRRGGAIETYVYGVSKALRNLGAEVHLVTIERREDVDYGGVVTHEVSTLSLINTKIRRLLFILHPHNRDIPYLTAKMLDIFDKIENHYGEIDVIHNHYFTTSFSPLVYKYFKRSYMLTVSHLHNEPKPSKIGKVLAKAYDMYLAVSTYIKRRAVELLKVSPVKVGVVYNAVDTDFFRPCNSSERADARERFEVENSDFVMVFIGRIVPEKGLHHLLLASKILKEKGYKFKILIAGPMGQFHTEGLKGYPRLCIEFLNKLNLQRDVRYVGRPERFEIRNLYCASDLVVVPSLWEDPCPTVVLEAMAMGRPVVAYASGGIPELVPPYGGIIVGRRNPIHLANAIETIIQGTAIFKELAIVEWVRRKFSYQAVAQKLLEIFTRMKN